MLKKADGLDGARRRAVRAIVFSASCLALVIAALFLSCSRSSTSKLTGRAAGLNVLVITLDTTRADAVGLYGNKNATTPSLDRLGREGVVFESCYTPVPLTLPSHCSIFTGRYPVGHGVRNNGTYVLGPDELTMAELFKAKGYETGAVIASFTVASKFGLSQGFDSYDEDFESDSAITNYAAEIPADKVYGKFSKWLAGRTAGVRFFGWVHFYDAHAPYVAHSSPSPTAAPPNSPSPTASGVAASPWSLYEGEVRFADAYVGRIVDDLKAKNLLDNTLIIVAGDHGEAFGEHKERGHGIFCYEESLRVPLVLYAPKVFAAPRAVASRVTLTDILPSLLDLCGMRIPDAVQGRSFVPLVAGAAEKAPRPVYFESLFGQEEFNWAPITGLIDGGRKFISLPEPELYDLAADARETRNLCPAEPDAARDMDKSLADFYRTHASTGGAARREPTAADTEKLRALGYVSSFSSKSPTMTDPKKAIDVYLEVTDLKDLLAAKDYAGAAARLAAVQAKHPGLELPDIYDVSYALARYAGKTADAQSILEKAIARFPERESFKMYMAIDYLEAGELEKARDFCRALVTENDKMTSAYVLLGDAEDRLGDFGAALADLDKAEALDPQNGLIRARMAAVLAHKGDLDRARALLSGLEGRPALTSTREFLDAQSALGTGLLAAGRADEAVVLFEKAAASNPGLPEVWTNLGSVQFRLKRYDVALQDFEKALAIDKNSGVALSDIGLVYVARAAEADDPSLAVKSLEYFDKAIAVQPGLAAAWQGRATARLGLGETADAVGDLERALKLDPGLLDAYINISIALRELGRPAEALRWLELCKERLYRRLPAAERAEVDRLISETKALVGGR